MAQQDYPVVGGNDVYTAPGPGASVANTLQAILAQRRAQSQEALINRLNQQKVDIEGQNVQSEIKSRADTAATNAAYRKSLEEASAQTVAEKKAEQGRLANVSGYYWNQWSDDPVIQRANEAAALDPRRAEPLEQIIANRLLANEAKPKMVPGYAFDDVTKRTVPYTHPATPPLVGDEPIMVPDNQPIHHIPRSAEFGTATHDSGTFAGPATDAQGNTIPGAFWVIRNGKMELQRPTGGENDLLGAKPKAPNDLKIPPGLLTAYTAARKAATTNAGIFSPAATDQAKAAYAQAEQNLMSQFPSAIVEIAKAIRDQQATVDPNAAVPNETLITSAISQGLVMAKDKDILYKLLEVIR